MINIKLARKQKLSDETIAEIELTQQELVDLTSTALVDIPSIPAYNKQVEELEFKLQRLWRFELDSTKHTYKFTQPLCKCGTIDNYELFGIDKFIVSELCPLHWNQV